MIGYRRQVLSLAHTGVFNMRCKEMRRLTTRVGKIQRSASGIPAPIAVLPRRRAEVVVPSLDLSNHFGTLGFDSPTSPKSALGRNSPVGWRSTSHVSKNCRLKCKKPCKKLRTNGRTSTPSNKLHWSTPCWPTWPAPEPRSANFHRKNASVGPIRFRRWPRPGAPT